MQLLSFYSIGRGANAAPRTAILLSALFVAACSTAAPFGPQAGLGSSASHVVASYRHHTGGYKFVTLDNPDDLKYNQLTGINNLAKLTGFEGSGAKGDPSIGYVVHRPYAPQNFFEEPYPTAVDTRITSLNNMKVIAGYYSVQRGWIFGCIYENGIWSSYQDPKLQRSKINITELLGISDANLAVGFYENDTKNDYAFELNPASGEFHGISPPGATSSVASGINGKGDIVGWATVGGGTVAYLLKGGIFTFLSYPGSVETKATAVNWQDQISGSYVDHAGVTHGFVLTNPLVSQQWLSVDDPLAAGTTFINSIENHDRVVGYYVDAQGITHGFIGSPGK
ncbi:MAG: hypothetical protein JO324_01600 [Candidatus Eremiobacteraeota bacterium]|nr:hypothetical protein [Candidatus Eremiobacteraeota bacterium]